MGSSNSRPKICQVAPSHSQPIEEEPSLFPTSPWMITAVKGAEMQEKGIVGQRKTNHLPPLTGRHTITNSVPLEPGSQNVCDKTVHSIIKSYPPQPSKGWQPMTLAIGADLNPVKHACKAYKTAESEDREWRDGPVHCYSTPSLGGHCGTSKTLQGHMKGLLLAQTMLSRQATKKQQAQQRCFRESRRKQKRVYTSYLEEDEMDGRQRVRLVSRPMQQNIFWNESEGQILDIREILQPRQTSGEGMLPNSQSCRTNLDRGLTGTVQRPYNANIKLPWHTENEYDITLGYPGQFIHRKNKTLTRGLCSRQTQKSTVSPERMQAQEYIKGCFKPICTASVVLSITQTTLTHPLVHK